MTRPEQHRSGRAVGNDADIATLVHLNGPPGAGKSTIASALVAARPLALGIEIDMLRTWLGQWETEESSKGIAREIAYAMVSTPRPRTRRGAATARRP